MRWPEAFTKQRIVLVIVLLFLMLPMVLIMKYGLGLVGHQSFEKQYKAYEKSDGKAASSSRYLGRAVEILDYAYLVKIDGWGKPWMDKYFYIFSARPVESKLHGAKLISWKKLDSNRTYKVFEVRQANHGIGEASQASCATGLIQLMTLS